MKKTILILLAWLTCFGAFAQTIKSPSQKLSLTFAINGEGEPTYQLFLGKKEVIKTSKLGLELKDLPAFAKGFKVSKIDTTSSNTTWEPVWGEVKQIRNNYKELAVTLTQADAENRNLIIRFRLYDDGLGFRYEFPQQKNLQYFTITNELTQFSLTGDHKAFWLPGDYDTNEYNYSTSDLSKVNSQEFAQKQNIHAQSPIKNTSVQTPLMLKTKDGLYINVHEAALVNYPVMNLDVDQKNFILTAHLVPDAVGNKAYMQAPTHTPWRTVIASEKATDIIASKLVLNLNEPTKLKDVSWIEPQKYIGIWWEMHVGKASWNYADTNNIKIENTDWSKLKPNGKHGANTKRTMEYIDFAAKHGFKGILVEGWNVGWEDWFGNWKENVFDFVTPYPDFDVKKLHQYAASKGVKLIMHHETSGSVTNYEQRQDTAFKFMKANGYDAVKTGYVGRIIPRGEHHDGQWMVNHFVRTAEEAAKHKIMVNAHESMRLSGLHRTYPNWLASEAARGMEFNAWSSGNPPEHETILPFTRLVGGPMDYTPGIFQIKLDYYDPNKKEQVQTTLAKQLALYVTLYSPFQMAADIPENYERFMDAFQFIKDVAVDWDDTKVLEAEPGDYLTIARKAKGKDEWFVGAITDENARNSQVPLNFLDKNKKYLATIYADAKDAHWQKNPMAYQINNFIVDSKTAMKLNLVSGGGTAISLKPASKEDQKKFKAYK